MVGSRSLVCLNARSNQPEIEVASVKPNCENYQYFEHSARFRMASSTNNTSRYWIPFVVDGQEVSLLHLDPFEFRCPTPDGNDRRVKVVYSSHVFTRSRTETDNLESVCFDNRVFCPERYSESMNLMSSLARLPNCKVFQTWEKRNYLYFADEEPNEAGRYHVFFEVMKKGGKRNRHVELRVESAYRAVDTSYLPSKRPNSVRFSILVQNVLMERPLVFAAR